MINDEAKVLIQETDMRLDANSKTSVHCVADHCVFSLPRQVLEIALLNPNFPRYFFVSI